MQRVVGVDRECFGAARDYEIGAAFEPEFVTPNLRRQCAALLHDRHTIQRRLAWPLRKDDTHINREGYTVYEHHTMPVNVEVDRYRMHGSSHVTDIERLGSWGFEQRLGGTKRTVAWRGARQAAATSRARRAQEALQMQRDLIECYSDATFQQKLDALLEKYPAAWTDVAPHRSATRTQPICARGDRFSRATFGFRFDFGARCTS